MNSFFTYIAIVLCWIFSFVEPSGWALIIHLTDILNLAIGILSVLFLLIKRQRKQIIPGVLVLGLFMTFIFIPYIMYDSLEGVSYLTSFLVVYIFSQAEVTNSVIKFSGISIALMGIFIMLVYTNTEILSGWNDNAISMVGLFSYLYFLIFLVLRKGTKSFWMWNIITLINLQLLFSTNCRSGMLFSVIAVMAIFWSETSRKMLDGKMKSLLILNIPLILAFCIVALSNSTYFEALNTWSIEKTDKVIFNGRDEIWNLSLQLLQDSYCLGTGKFLINYHNSGIAALSVFGVGGYLCWILYFNRIFRQFRCYLNDSVVFGCMLAFVLIFLQQSVDLGFISADYNRLPYMVLGLGLGRTFLLKDSIK